MVEIVKYITEQGKCPFDDFIKELIESGCIDDIAKINAYIKLLEVEGNNILKNSNWAKRISFKIYELRPKANRILYFVYKDDKIVLLHGFKKKSQKTPLNEINKAISEAADYERRNGYEQ